MKSLIVLALTAVVVNAQVLRVDSVCVDSTWNSDSSWYDDNGILVQRAARDLIVSFITVADTQSIVLLDSIAFSLSLDSGRTWGQSPSPLRIVRTAAFVRNQKQSVQLRVFGADRNNVAIAAYVRGRPSLDSITDKIAGPLYSNGLTWTCKLVDSINDTVRCSIIFHPAGCNSFPFNCQQEYNMIADLYISFNSNMLEGVGTWSQPTDSTITVNFSSCWMGDIHSLNTTGNPDTTPVSDSIAKLITTPMLMQLSASDTIIYYPLDALYGYTYIVGCATCAQPPVMLTCDTMTVPGYGQRAAVLKLVLPDYLKMSTINKLASMASGLDIQDSTRFRINTNESL
jgi:hypothetical protein